MVSVPLRIGPGLASKVNVAGPLPLPLDVVCSQAALAVALQAPPAPTRSESLPAVGPSWREGVTRITSVVKVETGLV